MGAGADADTAGAWRLRLDKNGRMLLGDNLTDTSIDTNYQLQVKGTANITENLTVDGELDALGGTLRVKDNRIGISTDPDSSAKVLIGGSLSTNGDCKLGGMVTIGTTLTSPRTYPPPAYNGSHHLYVPNGTGYIVGLTVGGDLTAAVISTYSCGHIK